jgi:xanthine dehydrogenase accessory factor
MSELNRIGSDACSAAERGERSALATLVRTRGATYRKSGARMLVLESGEAVGAISGGCVDTSVIETALRVIRSGRSELVSYDGALDDPLFGSGNMCDGSVEILIEPVDAELLAQLSSCGRRRTGRVSIVRSSPEEAWKTVVETGDDPRPEVHTEILLEEVIEPSPGLLLFGAGAATTALAQSASRLGWRVQIFDHREEVRARLSREGYQAREYDLDRLCCDDDAGWTGAVVMTHQWLRDIEIVSRLLSVDLPYIGVVSSRERAAKLARALRSEGIDPSPLHAPVGLDLGGETPEEMALSILAEVVAVRHRREGGRLMEREGPIHSHRDHRSTAALVLAAGRSSRMGSDKLALDVGGEPMLFHTVRTVASTGVGDVVVVVRETSSGELSSLPATMVGNPDADEGIGSSIRRGIAAVSDLSRRLDSVLVVLADQPAVGEAGLRALLDTYRTSRVRAVASRYPEGAGVPAVFDRSLWEELAGIEGDEGARRILRGLEERARRGEENLLLTLDLDGLTDVDTPADYARVGSQFSVLSSRRVGSKP